MKNLFIIFLIFTSANFAFAKKAKKKKNTKASIEAAIHQIEQLRYDAMVKADTTALSKLLHKNLEYYHSNGMQDSKQSLLEGIAIKKLVHNSIVVTKENIRLFDKTAIVTGEAKYDIVWDQKPMLLNFVFTNVYIKKKNGWMLVNRQTVKIN